MLAVTASSDSLNTTYLKIKQMQISKVFHIIIRFIPSLALSFEFVDQKIPKEKRKIDSVDPVEHQRKVMKVSILPSYP